MGRETIMSNERASFEVPEVACDNDCDPARGGGGILSRAVVCLTGGGLQELDVAGTPFLKGMCVRVGGNAFTWSRGGGG
jgi:hypothetical protein